MDSENNIVILAYNKLDAKLVLVEGRDCDKEDYLIASFCGVVAGLIDAFFVGKPNFENTTDNSLLGKEVDKLSESIVEKVADINISLDNKVYDQIAESLKGEGLSKRDFNKRLKEELVKHGVPENFSREKGYTGLRGNNSKITYLENKYRVSYDQSNSAKIKENIPFALSPDNHHLKSMAHWPDPIGLLFSILDQFTGQTTFIDNGEIYRVTPDQDIPALRGKTFEQKLFFGFVNWVGHLISDYCGSHSSKGRGDGIPIPFWGIFETCNFGSFDYGTSDTQTGLSLSDLATRVYENGYDSRFAITMSIPVVLQDLMIRFIWALKTHFVLKKDWMNCIPNDQHKDLRMMVLVGNGALCVVDGTDAIIRSQGNLLEFLLHVNIIGWYSLSKNVLKEICIRFDFTYEDLRVQYEYLNMQLDSYICGLKSINYELYEQQIYELNDISGLLIHDDWDVSVEAMDSYIKRKNIKTSFINKEDFKTKLIDRDFVFKIGGN